MGTWNADINNDVGSVRMSKITEEQCNELCTLMESIELKAAADNSGDLSRFDALNGSFAYDGEISREDRETMAEQWATVEDDPLVINAEIDELIENEMDDDNTTMNVDGGVNGDDGGGGNEDGDDDKMEISDNEQSINVPTDTSTKVTLLQAEEYLRQVQEYVKQSGAPVEITDRLLRIGNDLRKHNASKPRSNPTITHFFNRK